MRCIFRLVPHLSLLLLLDHLVITRSELVLGEVQWQDPLIQLSIMFLLHILCYYESP